MDININTKLSTSENLKIAKLFQDYADGKIDRSDAVIEIENFMNKAFVEGRNFEVSYSPDDELCY